MTRRKLIAGNWKMNGRRADGLALAEALIEKRGKGDFTADLLICPPATLLDCVGQRLRDTAIRLGGQDCHGAACGAHTGDISAAMIKDLGASHVILGHSERRACHHETDAIVRAKAEAALAAGLTAIVCLGETEAERQEGRAIDVVTSQLRGSLPAGATAENLVVAYEPVWAIGSGRTPTLDEVAEIHAVLRKELRVLLGSPADGVKLLYGGSVKPSNAQELMSLPDVDGGLIGGASLKAEEFWAIALASQGSRA